MGFVIGRRAALERSRWQQQLHSHMDLLDQWQYNAEDRPVALHAPNPCRRGPAVLRSTSTGAAVASRLDWLATGECNALINGMRRLGLETFLPAPAGAHHRDLFHAPPDPAYDFGDFYRRVREADYPVSGQATTVDTLEFGCIGAIGAERSFGRVAATPLYCGENGVRRTG